MISLTLEKEEQEKANWTEACSKLLHGLPRRTYLNAYNWPQSQYPTEVRSPNSISLLLPHRFSVIHGQVRLTTCTVSIWCLTCTYPCAYLDMPWNVHYHSDPLQSLPVHIICSRCPPLLESLSWVQFEHNAERWYMCPGS